MNDIQQTRKEAWRLFDRIAGRYDFLNRILSVRQDVLWRKKMAELLPDSPDLSLLDLATGTADQILFLLSETNKIGHATGIDLSVKMLELGRKKIAQKKIKNVTLSEGDASQIPFDSNQFDVSTISFGIRNIPDYPKALREMLRILKPGGRALILEFSLPKSDLIKSFYLYYFRNILPKIGGVLSGDSFAYRYLNETVEEFPYGNDFLNVMKSTGFINLQQHPLTFGIATIYVGEKQGSYSSVN